MHSKVLSSDIICIVLDSCGDRRKRIAIVSFWVARVQFQLLRFELCAWEFSFIKTPQVHIKANAREEKARDELAFAFSCHATLGAIEESEKEQLHPTASISPRLHVAEIVSLETVHWETAVELHCYELHHAEVSTLELPEFETVELIHPIEFCAAHVSTVAGPELHRAEVTRRPVIFAAEWAKCPQVDVVEITGTEDSSVKISIVEGPQLARATVTEPLMMHTCEIVTVETTLETEEYDEREVAYAAQTVEVPPLDAAVTVEPAETSGAVTVEVQHSDVLEPATDQVADNKVRDDSWVVRDDEQLAWLASRTAFAERLRNKRNGRQALVADEKPPKTSEKANCEQLITPTTSHKTETITPSLKEKSNESVAPSLKENNNELVAPSMKKKECEEGITLKNNPHQTTNLDNDEVSWMDARTMRPDTKLSKANTRNQMMKLTSPI